MKNSFFIFLIFLQSCIGQDLGGKLIFTKADSISGFNYPYFLFIPKTANPDLEQILMVEPNNSGFVDDNLEAHIEKAKRTASKDFYAGNYVARKLNFPLLIPVFPRSETNWKIYTHALDRDAVNQKNNALERLDLQLLAMVVNAQKKLAEMGFSVGEKILMTGFSASGTFVNRFTAIHPEKVKATAAGGLNGLLILPLDTLQDQHLNYPLGIHDFQLLFNKPFDSESFKNTPQFLFMGELDDNDAIPYEDGYDPDERDLIFKLLGKEMYPSRWNNCKNIYEKLGIKAQIKTFPGIGHEQPEKVKNEVRRSFTSNIC